MYENFVEEGGGGKRALLVSPPLLVSGTEARRLLSVGNTKYWALVGSGVLETVMVGRRRHVRYASIQRLVAQGSSE